MPDQVEGVVEIDPNGAADSTPTTPKYDDATLEAMAKKSGDTVEHMKKILGLYDDQVEKPKGDESNTGNKLFAGKYKSEGDLDKGIQNLIDKFGKEKAYKMLESQMGTDVNVSDKGDTSQNNKDALTPEGDNPDQTDNKIDMNKFYDEFAKSGQLSIESYKELADAGFDKGLVDSYIEGQAARVEIFTNNVYDAAGGQEQYDRMVDWGAKNLNTIQKQMFNDAVNSGNLESAKGVIDALKARFTRAEGTFKRGGIRPEGTGDSHSGEGFNSVQEMTTAMRDPRYRSDPAYVDMVKRKMKVSKF
jgi:hypothetical protein